MVIIYKLIKNKNNLKFIAKLKLIWNSILKINANIVWNIIWELI